MSTVLSHLWMIPYVLIYLFGLVFAIANWSRYPSAAGLAALAIVLMLGTMLVGTAFNFWLYNLGGLESLPNAATFSRLTGFLRTALDALGTAMLIAAVFVGRNTTTQPITAQFAGPAKQM